MIHVSAFLIVGTIAAVLAAEVEVAPPTLYLVVVFFAIFEFGFYVAVAVLAQPLLGSLAWWNVAIGNAIAAFGMGYYLWRVHPHTRADPPPPSPPRGGRGQEAPPSAPPPAAPAAFPAHP